MVIQWVTCDPATGAVIESLPGLRLESSLPCYVGRGDSVKVSLPVQQRPARWRIATEPNRTVLVAHYDDADQTILWAGPITYREYGSGPYITLTAESVDGWLATQYTGTRLGAPYSVINRDRSLILADMLAPAVADFHGEANVTLSGVTQSLTVADTEDKTCATVAASIMALGVEYRIGWRWDTAGQLVLVATVAPRIGAVTPAILLSSVEWTLTQDYSSDRGATIVTAVATTSGSIRNQATVQADTLIAAGYLRSEYRYTPDTGVTSTALLAEHAAGKLPVMQQGTVGVSLTFHPDGPVRINRDIRVGDVFEADLANPDMPEVAATLTARMLGFVAEADRTSGEIVRITPVLEAA